MWLTLYTVICCTLQIIIIIIIIITIITIIIIIKVLNGHTPVKKGSKLLEAS